ncbi:MAG: DUF2971 domain-containing protein, partial [Patescibacteria group bacterium]|nr:DUF2971 domain-containing protein [Patescibacteria group bacterium]
MPFVKDVGFTEIKGYPIVWRYIDFAKFVSMLENRALHFMRADKLLELDPYEGHFDELRILQQYKKYPKVYKKIEDHARYEHPKNLFVNCWHVNENQSDAMWKVYASQDKGIAIVSSLSNLMSSMKSSPEKIRFGKVQYVSRKEIIYNKDLHKRFLIKGDSYKHENEMRLFLFRPEDGRRDGIDLLVDLTSLILKIYVSPLSPDWFVELVRSIASKYGIRDNLVEKS